MSDIEQLINDAPSSEREATYLACWIVAFCDGRLWREKGLLERIATELRLPRKVARRIEGAARRGKRNLEEPETRAGRHLMFHFTLSVAAGDGRLTDREQNAVRRLGQHLGVNSEEVERQLRALAAKPRRPERRRPQRSDVKRSHSEDSEAKSLADHLRNVRADAVEAGKTHQFSTYVLPFLLMAASHLLPVFGVLFWEWEIPTILLLYWGETVVVGVVTVLRLRLSQPEKGMSVREAVPFFCIHYGVFTSVLGLFVLAVTARGAEEYTPAGLMAWLVPRLPGILLVLASIAIQHGFLFYTDFLREEQFRRTTVGDHFWRPYPKMLAMFVTVAFGGLGMQKLGYDRAVCVLMMVGIHLVIETLFWAYHLPSRGVLGAIQKMIAGTVIGGVTTAIALTVLSLVATPVLILLMGLLSSIIPGLGSLLGGLFSPRGSSWWALTAWITVLLATVSGTVIGLLVHIGKVSDEFAASLLRGRWRTMAFLGGLIVVAGILAAVIHDPSSVSAGGKQTLAAPGDAEFVVARGTGYKRTIQFRVRKPGAIRATATWDGGMPLALLINGPVSRNAVRRKDGRSPLSVEFDVTAEHLAKGDTWTVSVANFKSREPVSGKVAVTFPTDGPSESVPIEAPIPEPTARNLKAGGKEALAQPGDVMFLVARGAGYKRTIEFRVRKPGAIRATATWDGGMPLALLINGPVSRNAVRRKDGRSPLSVEFDVTAEHLAKGDTWTVSVANFQSRKPVSGKVSVIFPTDDESRAPPE